MTQKDYLRMIALAVINLCDKHTTLLERGGNSEARKHVERHCHFRIAHYLANALEDGQHDFFIDSDFNRDGNNTKHAEANDKGVTPDIIYHNRKSGNDANNIFVIEIKIGSTIRDNKDDRVKVYKYLTSILKYKYGFCISNISKNSFIIHIIRKRIQSSVPNKGRSVIIQYNKNNGAWGYQKLQKDKFDIS